MKIRISFVRFITLLTNYFLMFDTDRQDFLMQIFSAVRKAHGTPKEISIKTADLSHKHIDIAMDIFKALNIDAKPIQMDENGVHFSVK